VRPHHPFIFFVKPFPPLIAAPASRVAWHYSGNKAHPTEKAVKILTPLIRAFSQPGAIVLDPFAGSGSTAVAAALTGRSYIGIELDGRYCRHARNRLAGAEKYTERKAA
jgi:site-specific DNA-methyltransferase (adenine-specific)